MADTRTRFQTGAPDEMVSERYRLVRRIATGGMADVFLAMDTESGKEAAIKILPRAEDGGSVARFRREAEAVTALSHPHIVRVFDWGAVDGTHYIAMEYVPGPTLKQLIDERGAFPEDRALEIAAQVADALHFAHGRNVIHRDVKPENILLDELGNAKLLDFGIARVVDAIELTQTRSVLGTARYLSPEQARGEALNPRTDLYSLGVVLFEMLTGRVPFDAESPVAVALKHVDEAPPRPRAINPAVSPEAEAILLRAMEKDPNRRYASAGEMRDVLQAARTNGAFSRDDDPHCAGCGRCSRRRAGRDRWKRAPAAGGLATPEAPNARLDAAGYRDIGSPGWPRGAQPRWQRRSRGARRARDDPGGGRRQAHGSWAAPRGHRHARER